MSVVGHAPPPFFKRSPAPLVRLAFYVLVSLVILVADLRFHTLDWVRLGLGTATWPLQRLAYMPVEMVGGIGRYFSSLNTLRKENEELHSRQLATANLLLRQRHLEDENKHLRALLDMRARLPARGLVADILYASRDPFSRRVVIDKGLQQGIAAGRAVIDDIGVIGQVTRVFPLVSEVTLLTDRNQYIPVQVERNGLRAVLAGAGNGLMDLRYMPANAEVRPGDILSTSGLDDVYLPGLPVAKVLRVDRENAFARIVCAPIAGVERHGQVMVLERRQVSAVPRDIPAESGTEAPSPPAGRER